MKASEPIAMYQLGLVAAYPKKKGFLHYASDCAWHNMGVGFLIPESLYMKYQNIFTPVAKWKIYLKP